MDKSMNQQKQYLAYLLRLWQDSGGSPLWRASLESPQSHELQAFADPEELFAFLREQMYGAPPKSGGALGEESHSDSRQ